MNDQPTVAIPLEAARALFAVYHAWQYEVGTYDSTGVVTENGTPVDGYSLMSIKDGRRMDDAIDAVGPYESDLRQIIGWR